MCKEAILKDVKTFNKNLEFSDVIKDDYFKRKRLNIVADGYGIYDLKDKKATHRYCLLVDIKDKTDKTIFALLMNPSNTFAKGLNGTKKSKFDQTIRNIIKFVSDFGYGHLIVLNAFSLICGNGKSAKEKKKKNKNSQEEKLNREFIENILKTDISKELLVACGDGVPADLYEYYFDLIEKNANNLKILTYAKELTKNHRPRHFSLQSSKNREFYNKRELYELEIKDNEFVPKDTPYIQKK